MSHNKRATYKKQVYFYILAMNSNEYNSSKRMKYLDASRVKGETYHVHGIEYLPIKLSIFSKLIQFQLNSCYNPARFLIDTEMIF